MTTTQAPATITTSTWHDKVAARAAGISDPLAAVLAMTPYQRQCGRLEASALASSLDTHGWRPYGVSYTQPNYDRVPGGPGLSSATASTRDWYHADHPGHVIRVTDGVNHRAGTSWGGVRLLDGDELAGAIASIAAREADRTRRENERARLAALPPGSLPGIRDYDLRRLSRASWDAQTSLGEAWDAISGVEMWGANAAFAAEWEAARDAVHAASALIREMGMKTSAAMTGRSLTIETGDQES